MKVKEFQAILKKRKIDFALFYNLNPMEENKNLFYFSGYKGIGALVISQKMAFLLVPAMEYEKAKKSRVKRVYKLDKKRLFESVLDGVKKNKIKKKNMGIEKGIVTLNEYASFKKYFKKCKTVNISGICLNIRSTKVKEEIEIIRKACKLTDDILGKCFKNFKRFNYETDVSDFLEQEVKKKGHSLSFPTIVASGKGSSQPHYGTKKAKLRKGFCVIDFGIKYNGYCSDVTRTVYLGNPSKKEKEFYELLLAVQKGAIDMIKSGLNGGKAVGYVNKSLGKYKKNFTHGLGHGIGVQLHELPNLKEESKDKFSDGSIFTVEPGIYFFGKFGIRIEDDILITKGRAEILSKINKELIIIKKR